MVGGQSVEFGLIDWPITIPYSLDHTESPAKPESGRAQLPGVSAPMNARHFWRWLLMLSSIPPEPAGTLINQLATFKLNWSFLKTAGGGTHTGAPDLSLPRLDPRAKPSGRSYSSLAALLQANSPPASAWGRAKLHPKSSA